MCYLAGIEKFAVPRLSAALTAVGYPIPKIVNGVRVTELGLVKPRVLVIDLDSLDGDRFELIRQLRFVLPDCNIAVFTANLAREWATKCHLSGANCLLAKTSDASRIAAGLKQARDFGCFTDPAFGGVS
jgi:DNA-binding NarL/FixJ family response regulator